MKKLALDKIRRILVTRTDRIGDVVLSTPVFSALRKVFPRSYIAAMVLPETKNVIEGHPALDEVIVYDKKGSQKDFFSAVKFSGEIAKMKFDIVINLYPSNRMHIMSFLAGIPVRIGYKRNFSNLLTHTVEDSKKEGAKHESEYNFELLNILGVHPPKKMELFFALKQKARQDLTGLLMNKGMVLGKEPYVVINPGASCPSKVWSPLRFARVGDYISEKYGKNIVLMGGKKEKRISSIVREIMRKKPVDVTGETDIAMIGWLLRFSSLLVSNDSGPVHIAAALKTPVISIFGRSQPGLSPVRWRPLGENTSFIKKDTDCPVCLAHECKNAFMCLDTVEIDDVFREIDKYGNFLRG